MHPGMIKAAEDVTVIKHWLRQLCFLYVETSFMNNNFVGSLHLSFLSTRTIKKSTEHESYARVPCV
jgi:hypothetical protein